MEKFKLETPTLEREQDALNFIQEFYEYKSNINGTGSLHNFLDNYPAWLLKLEKDRVAIPSEERVPAETYFLVRESDKQIVGMTNIRLALNERLKKGSGHIGYCIRPTERRKGYNKINLYLSLLVCQEHGIKEVLMSCDKDNLASAKTMQALGGVMVKEYFDDEDAQGLVQNYVFDTDKSIETHKDTYSAYISDEKVKC